MEIKIENLWKDLNDKFDANRSLDLLTLSLLLRLTIEKHQLKKAFSDSIYSSLHNLLHFKTHISSKETNIDTLFKIITKIYLLINDQEKIKINNICTSLSNNSKDDFFNVDSTQPKAIKNWKDQIIYINAFSVISVKNKIYQYRFTVKGKEKKYTFLSKDFLGVKKPYKISLGYVSLNSKFQRFWLLKYESWQEEFKKLFKKKTKLDWSNEPEYFYNKFNLTPCPEVYDEKKENRKFIWLSHAALSMNPDILDNFRYEKYFPFSKFLLNGKLPTTELKISEKIKIIEMWRGQTWFNEDYRKNFDAKNEADLTNDIVSPLKETSVGHDFCSIKPHELF